MNERQAEQQIRQHLRQRAESGGVPPEFRAVVRQRLDNYEHSSESDVEEHSFWGTWPAAASLVGLLGVLGIALVLFTSGGASDDASTQDSTLPVVQDPVGQQPVAGTQVDTGDLSVALSLVVPDSVDRRVSEINSSENILELSLAGPATADPPRVPLLRIIVAPDGSSIESIVADLTSNLLDTRVIEIADDALGGRPTRVVRMESDLGTTLVGFKLGPGSFISASGVDRRYEVHVMSTPSGPLIIWIDAAQDGFSEIRRDVDAIVATLELT